MRASVVSAMVSLAIAGIAGAACYTAPDKPGDAEVATTIGATPLRRLTNAEYKNALHDLFPAQNPALPPLPIDIPVAGFENAAEAQSPSDVLVSRYETIATLYADAATRDAPTLRALVGCDDWSTPELASACAHRFFDTTGTRLFRRPLADDELQRFLLRFNAWQSAIDFEGAVQLSLSAMLQSPQFLYRAEPFSASGAGEGTAGSVVPVDAYAMATRLSFFLWESVPDARLLEAAARGELGTEEQIRDQATRMLADDRARRVFWNFLRQWLGLDRILLVEHAVRTTEVDPAWSAASQASVNEETKRFVENVLAQGGTFRDLMTSRRAWVDGEMARIYGLPAPANRDAWTEVQLPEGERAGLLTRASFLAGYSHPGATSPPVRGNGIELRFLCQLPTSPPPTADLSQPVAAAGEGPQTTRMLFERRTQPSMCQSCHRQLDGFGFGLENYDAAGHYRTNENGLLVDASGHVRRTDVDGPFTGGVQLASVLSASETVHACATQELLRYALGRAPSEGEGPEVLGLTRRFMTSQGDLRALLVAITLSPSFRMRRVEETTP